MDLMKTSVANVLLKRKESQDSEFTILDIVEGVGDKSGMCWAYGIQKPIKVLSFIVILKVIGNI
jgi:hypothetical protein